ncbi:MAG TPA: right-handed parallel beta-helix repeat-containing protein [Draconibacterium sp.]|nr:right-handed parallel beta-helix repeat-containing protein [Draconibacterium sp.]
MKQFQLFPVIKSSISVLLIFVSVSTCLAKDIYVSPNGNDNNPGTKKKPFQTIQHAKSTAIELMKKGGENELNVWLADGIYQVSEPLVFEPLNAMQKNTKISFNAEKGSTPVISGGVQISGWTKNSAGIWEAGLPENIDKSTKIRELFIDGKRAVRARFPNERYLKIKKAGADRRTNFYFEKGDFPVPSNVENVELILLHDWSISRIAVKEINSVEGKLTAVDSIGARQPDFFNIDNWEPNPRYFLENAAEFLDADFEWYFDANKNKILLKLPENQNPETSKIVVPVSNGLLQLKGQENNLLKNIHFEGIAFENCVWNIPGKGYCGVQACHFDPRPENEGWSVVPVAVYAEWTENATFNNCNFQNLGGSGLWFSTGCKNCSVENSGFFDISGNGIMIGEGQDRLVNGKQWWQVAPNQVALGNTIENCTIKNCGTQFFGAVGIWCGLTAETTIRNNEISDLPYSGISIGWMWSPVATPCRANVIDGNHIHHIMQILSDGGGIYMLGLQPGSKITNNKIHDVKINAGRAESNGMFLDEGTTDVLVENNLIYNIAKSPLRFHKATINLVKDNFLFCAGENPPIRYNSTKEDDIRKVGNKVFLGKELNYEKELNVAIKKWK